MCTLTHCLAARLSHATLPSAVLFKLNVFACKQGVCEALLLHVCTLLRQHLDNKCVIASPVCLTARVCGHWEQSTSQLDCWCAAALRRGCTPIVHLGVETAVCAGCFRSHQHDPISISTSGD
eukprot:3527100-Amphidinium_carterae.1